MRSAAPRCCIPHFARSRNEAGAPLNLIEIGPSAGLNLIWDRYGVNYNRDGKTWRPSRPMRRLSSNANCVAKKSRPPGRHPRVGRRMGLELNPVDLSNADDRDWLRALMWPDQIARLERLDKAMALFREGKPEIREGDALALLSDALREMPESETGLRLSHHRGLSVQPRDEGNAARYLDGCGPSPSRPAPVVRSRSRLMAAAPSR